MKPEAYQSVNFKNLHNLPFYSIRKANWLILKKINLFKPNGWLKLNLMHLYERSYSCLHPDIEYLNDSNRYIRHVLNDLISPKLTHIQSNNENFINKVSLIKNYIKKLNEENSKIIKIFEYKENESITEYRLKNYFSWKDELNDFFKKSIDFIKEAIELGFSEEQLNTTYKKYAKNLDKKRKKIESNIFSTINRDVVFGIYYPILCIVCCGICISTANSCLDEEFEIPDWRYTIFPNLEPLPDIPERPRSMLEQNSKKGALLFLMRPKKENLDSGLDLLPSQSNDLERKEWFFCKKL